MSGVFSTIRELHEAVWQTPLKKLAEQYEIHAHALGKLCDDCGIPHPSLAVGHKHQSIKQIGSRTIH
jgi:hypothetical protein